MTSRIRSRQTVLYTGLGPLACPLVELAATFTACPLCMCTWKTFPREPSSIICRAAVTLLTIACGEDHKTWINARCLL